MIDIKGVLALFFGSFSPGTRVAMERKAAAFRHLSERADAKVFSGESNWYLVGLDNIHVFSKGSFRRYSKTGVSLLEKKAEEYFTSSVAGLRKDDGGPVAVERIDDLWNFAPFRDFTSHPEREKAEIYLVATPGCKCFLTKEVIDEKLPWLWKTPPFFAAGGGKPAR